MILKVRKSTIAVLACLILIAVIGAACTPVLGKNHVKMITGVETDYNAVYPLANTEISCKAADPEGGSLIYTWTCNKGTFQGTGSTVTWIAPNQLGRFPVMVTVENSSGMTDEYIIYITVVSHDSSCSTCGR